jgi:hypothetical protein
MRKVEYLGVPSGYRVRVRVGFLFFFFFFFFFSLCLESLESMFAGRITEYIYAFIFYKNQLLYKL